MNTSDNQAAMSLQGRGHDDTALYMSKLLFAVYCTYQYQPININPSESRWEDKKVDDETDTRQAGRDRSLSRFLSHMFTYQTQLVELRSDNKEDE